MKKKIFKIIGISLIVIILIIIICLVIFATCYLSITTKDDFVVYREFYSPNGEYVVVDCTDSWGLRDIDGFLHIYKTDDILSKNYSDKGENAIWIIVDYYDFIYSTPYLISWIDNTQIRINNECFDINNGEYVEDYIPTFPFYSITEFYSPNGKYVVVDCTKKEEKGRSSIILLYEVDNYVSFIDDPEKIYGDKNYLTIIEDDEGNFGTASGGNPYRIKWLNNEEVRIENAVYSIVNDRIIKEY